RTNRSPSGETASRAVADWLVSRSRCVAHGCAADSEVRSSLGLCGHSPARPESAEETANRNEDAAAHVRSSYKLNRFRPLAPLAALHLCQSFSPFQRAQVRRGSEDLRFRVAALRPRLASKCTESGLLNCLIAQSNGL